MAGTLVAEALAQGDMGLAVAALSPGSVATAIGLWGTEEQQQTYLPAFAGNDVPVAHRQSVAFMVANIAIELQAMRLVTYRAASRLAQGKGAAREVGLARRICAEKGMQIGLDGVQLLGGHGFVKEHPVERWYRDLRAAGVMEGALLA